MLSFHVGARFLRKSPLQTCLILIGIGVGIGTAIFVGSLITSLQKDLIQTTVGSSPHLTVLPEGQPAVPGSLADEIAGEPEVTVAIPVRRTSALVTLGEESRGLGVISGSASDLDRLYRLSGRLVSGDYRLDRAEVLVGVGLAESADVSPGESIDLVFPDGSGASLRVAGVFDLGSAAANDGLVFMDSSSGATALGLEPDEYTAIEVQVDDVFGSSDVALRLSGIPDVRIVDWQDENEELLNGLAAQSGSSLLIQAFVMLAVALGIASTLAINAVQKSRQVGILKALGMTDGQSARVFLWQGLFLGSIGVGLGIGLGALLIWGFSRAPVDFTVALDPALTVATAAIGLSVAVLSAAIPSWRTSRLDPVEVIQSG